MEQQVNNEQEMQIDLLKILKLAKKFWVSMLVLAVLFSGLVALVYAKLYTPVYSSTSEFYVSNISTDSPLYSSGQTSAAMDMAEIEINFVSGNRFLNFVKEDLQTQGIEIELKKLGKMVSGKSASGSAILVSTVKGENPELNLAIARSIEKLLPVYCDKMNNQGDEKITMEEMIAKVNQAGGGYDSQTTKINNYAVLDKVADNRMNLIKYPAIAFFAVVVLEFAFLFVYSLLNVTIYTESDLTEQLKEPVLGIIPEISLKKKKHKRTLDLFVKRIPEREILPMLDENSSFLMTEAFHRLRSNITFCSNGGKGCAIGVSSSTAAFGKTYTMCNLSISLSQMLEKKVLLIDGDLRCPAVHQFLKLDNKKGLSNLLAGQISEKEAMKEVSPSFHVITAGSIPPNPIELLSCKRMEELMAAWKTEYDFILVDLPPIGEVADAFAMLPMLSGFLFAVRSHYANARFEQRALNLMKEKNAKLFGYVLTDVETAETKKDHYYYYNKKDHNYYSSYYAKKKEEGKQEQQ